MSKTTIHSFIVQFGDCDPAGIVFFPNFMRWMDASSMNFFRECGLPPWREMTVTHGILGSPVLEINTRFSSPAVYGDCLDIHTTVEDWQNKVFKHRHRVMCGDRLVCEGTEVRAFVANDDTGRMRAIPVPAEILAACS